MRHFSISVEIAAPPERVWAVMSDVQRWREWTPSVTSISILRGSALTVGSSAIIRQPGFPPALWKVSEVEPGRRFIWVSTGPGFRVTARHSVEEVPGGSRATLSLELTGLLGGLFGRLTKGVTERYLALEAAGLKARCENPEFRHSGKASA